MGLDANPGRGSGSGKTRPLPRPPRHLREPDAATIDYGAAKAALVNLSKTLAPAIIAGIGGFATGRITTPEEVATLITFPGVRTGRKPHRRQLHH
jgi:hypothetical protein